MATPRLGLVVEDKPTELSCTVSVLLFETCVVARLACAWCMCTRFCLVWLHSCSCFTVRIYTLEQN